MPNFNNGNIELRDFPSFSFGNFEECKIILKKSFLELDKTIKKVRWIPEYDEVAKWMTNTNKKGLFLTGEVGLGKTIIVDKIIPSIFLKYYNKKVNTFQAQELGSFLEIAKQKKFISIDDIGSETIHNEYGTKFEPVIQLFSHAEYKNKIVFASSNLNSQDFLERYGERTYDRLIRLCFVVKFSGNSFRK